MWTKYPKVPILVCSSEDLASWERANAERRAYLWMDRGESWIRNMPKVPPEARLAGVFLHMRHLMPETVWWRMLDGHLNRQGINWLQIQKRRKLQTVLVLPPRFGSYAEPLQRYVAQIP